MKDFFVFIHIHTYIYYTIVIHNEAHFMLIYDMANSISAIGCRSSSRDYY